MKQKETPFNGLIALGLAVIGFLLIMIGFNYKSIILSCKGYSPSQVNMILEMDDQDQETFLNEAKFEHLDWWMLLETDVSCYPELEKTAKRYPELDGQAVYEIYIKGEL